MKNRVRDFRKMVRKCIFSIYGIQIFSILIYYMIYYLVLMLYGLKNMKTSEAQAAAEVNLPLQLFISVITELFVCILAYKKIWKIGDFHVGEVLTGGTELKKKLGFKIGVLSVVPVYACVLITSVLRLFDAEISVLKYVLALFVSRWSGVVNYITNQISDSAWIGLMVYAVVFLPLIFTSALAYKNGFCGLHQEILPKKHHSPVVGNVDAIQYWYNSL